MYINKLLCIGHYQKLKISKDQKVWKQVVNDQNSIETNKDRNR